MSDTAQTMDAETLEALRGSIAKWEAIVAGTGKDDGIDNCALCSLFYTPADPTDFMNCTGCPVMKVTGSMYCDGSPYETYRRTSPGSVDERDAAIAELDFLKSLLPVEAA